MVKHKKGNDREIQVPKLITVVNEPETAQNCHPCTEPTRVQLAHRARSQPSENNTNKKKKYQNDSSGKKCTQ